MGDFPDFVKNQKNRTASESEYTEAIEGYVFDGADGSQVVFFRANEDRLSKEHTHPFDEWVHVLEGRCVVFAHDTERVLEAGDELLIPKGTPQRMAVTGGTRTVHVFGGKRAERRSDG
jgi:quercetin dioxygenase-like cupin family protein